MSKFFIILFTFLLLSCGSTKVTFTSSEPEDFSKIEYSHNIAIVNNDFGQAKLWIAETYNSAKDVITYEDKDMGIITGRCIISHSMFKWICNFKIAINNENVNLTYSNLSSYPSGGIVYARQPYNMIKEETNKLAESLFAALDN